MRAPKAADRILHAGLDAELAAAELAADDLPPVTAANMDQFRETDFTLCLGNVLGVVRAEGRYGIRRDELIASVAHNLRAVAYAIRLLWTLGHVRLEGGRVYTW